MSGADAEPSSARLERALEAFLQHAEGGGGDADQLLEQHGDLRELLEPMLAAGDDGDAREPAALGRSMPDASVAGGAVLGDFRLVRELGRGGMGIVYEAWQRSLDRPVALKVLSPGLVASPSAIARFRREAATVGKLRHPGIVEVHGFGSDGDRHWFAMGLVDGEPLTKCAKRFSTPELAVGLTVQVLDALQHAHAAGLVHRDVKPGNLIVRADGTAVLTDFGLAHDAELPSVTTEGSFLGTLEYASPEQVQGGQIDVRTDVWSVGAMLYELLAGARPFSRASATATLRAILTEDQPTLRRRAGVSSDLAAIVDRALQKDPARRYPGAREFLADLRAWQAGGLVSARAPGVLERVLRWTRREPWRATTAVVLVLGAPLLTASVGYLWANAPRIEAAVLSEQRQRREDALTTAWLSLADEDVAPGLQALDALAAPATDLEVAVVRAALLLRRGDRETAKAALLPVAGQPAARFVALQIENADARLAIDFQKVEAGSAIECFVLGLLAYEQVNVHKQEPALYAQASRWLGAAVARAQEPRAAFLFWWMVTSARARDGAAFHAAFTAYEHHFPGSPGLRTACVLCAGAVPVERGLRILGEIDLQQQPRANLSMALLLDRAGRSAESEGFYRAGLAADPKNLKAWLQFVGVLDEQKKFADAAAAATTATEIDPHSAEAWSRLGTSLLQSGRPLEAREAFENAIAEAPGVWRPHFHLAQLQREAGEDEPALASFRRASDLAPTQPEPFTYCASLLRRLARPQEALAADLRALQCAPGNWRQWMAVGVGASELGMHDLALGHAARATELAPDNATAWSRLAEVLLAMPQVDGPRALAAAKKGDDLAKGEDARGVWLLARAEAATGDRAAATARLEALLAGQKEVPVAVRRLAEAELEKVRAAK